MNTDLKEFILQGLSEGKSIAQLTIILKAAGWSSEIIEQAFQSSGVPLPEAIPTIRPPEPPPTKTIPYEERQLLGTPLTPTTVFIITGVLLIIAAMIIAIVTQWSNVSSVGRILLLAIPMLLLWLISFFLRNKMKYHQIYLATLGTACVMFPFTFGTMLYQLGIINQISPLLIFWTSIASLPIYFAVEFQHDLPDFTFFPIVNLYVTLWTAAANWQWPSSLVCWALLALSGLILSTVLLTNRPNRKEKDSYYLLVSNIAIFLTLLFSFSLLGNFNDNAIQIILINLTALGISLYYRRLAKLGKIFTSIGIYQTCSLIENTVPITLLLPFLFNGLGSLTYSLEAFAISLILLGSSIYVPISSFLPIGAIGLFITTLLLSSQLFLNSLGWPVTVFASGFLMIGLGFLVQKLRTGTHNQYYSQWFSFEEPGEKNASSFTHHTHMNPFLIFVLIILALWMLPTLFGTLFYASRQNITVQSNPQIQDNTPNSEVTATASPTPIADTSAPIITNPLIPISPTAPSLTNTQLENFTYNDINGVSRTLVNGTTTFSATGTTGSLTLIPSLTASGDLNNDGVADSVVVLSDNLGGTGNPPLIAVVLNQGGEPILSGEHTILNDADENPVVNSVTITNSLITVRGFVHSSNQSDADTPNQPAIETYRLVNGLLVAL